MTVDHIVPIAGCRICGLKGVHEPDNWQMITAATTPRRATVVKLCCPLRRARTLKRFNASLAGAYERARPPEVARLFIAAVIAFS